jgi:hypothetical protein
MPSSSDDFTAFFTIKMKHFMNLESHSAVFIRYPSGLNSTYISNTMQVRFFYLIITHGGVGCPKITFMV